MRARKLFLLPLALLLASCGGEGLTNVGMVPPPPTPGQGNGGSQNSGNNSVTLVVFYDENSNGIMDGGEDGRVPEVEVQLGPQTGRSQEPTGRVALTGVPTGTQSLSVHPETLPPFYEPPGPAVVRVPDDTTREVPVPLRLRIGQNRPAHYMAFGDSITVGDGSGDGAGYRNRLASKLVRTFGEAVISNQGATATQTDFGAARIAGSLQTVRPAYTLIHYGTNDFNTASCRSHFPCHVVDNLRLMVRRCKNTSSLPVLATIIPANPQLNIPERNQWVARMNDLIRPMAAEEGALLADLEEKFLGAGNLPGMFADKVHPNDRGYEAMAAGWFEAITHGSVNAPAPQRRSGLLLPRP